MEGFSGFWIMHDGPHPGIKEPPPGGGRPAVDFRVRDYNQCTIALVAPCFTSQRQDEAVTRTDRTLQIRILDNVDPIVGGVPLSGGVDLVVTNTCPRGGLELHVAV